MKAILKIACLFAILAVVVATVSPKNLKNHQFNALASDTKAENNFIKVHEKRGYHPPPPPGPPGPPGPPHDPPHSDPPNRRPPPPPQGGHNPPPHPPNYRPPNYKHGHP